MRFFTRYSHCFEEMHTAVTGMRKSAAACGFCCFQQLRARNQIVYEVLHRYPEIRVMWMIEEEAHA